MAGDRRATSGNLISHRTMEKVFPADRYSGVAIAGAAGPAMEMVKLFQLQLEHYEKVEGAHLSLEGKANQLGQMVRNHLPAAMQGLAVVPLFAGYDTRRQVGRLFQYDVTGGRYEESDFAATGSGSLHAGTVVKLGYREGLDRGAVVDLALSALFQAADEDSATGGPDLRPRHLPGDGHHHRRRASSGSPTTRSPSASERRSTGSPTPASAAPTVGRTPPTDDGGDAPMSMPFYVAPEQVMKDRADYARKGIARGRSLVGGHLRRRHPHLRREPVGHAAQGQRDLRPHRLRRRRPVQRVRPAAHRRRPPRRPQGLLLQPRGRRRPQPGQPVRPDPRPGLHPRDEADGGRDPRRRGRRRRQADDQLFHILYDGTVVDEEGFSVLGGEAEAIAERMRQACEPRHRPRRRRSPPRSPRSPGPTAQLRADDLEVAVLGRTNGRRTFRRLSDEEVAAVLGPEHGRTCPDAPPAARRTTRCPATATPTGQTPARRRRGAGDDEPPERA